MKICDNVHQIRIHFNVTEDIKRYVYIYIIEGKKLYLVDSGVKGSEKIIEDYLFSINKSIKDIKGIFLTHSHPDHIGSAAKLKGLSKSKIYAPYDEKEWIEDIDKQFKERPIPNFYGLSDKSVKIDKYLKKKEIIKLEEDIHFKVVDASGHSRGSLSYLWIERNILFTGDAVPVPGDIPIFTDFKRSIDTLERLKSIDEINFCLPAWDRVYNKNEYKGVIDSSIKLLNNINDEVRCLKLKTNDKKEIFENVCNNLNMNSFKSNPLFKKSVLSCLDKE